MGGFDWGEAARRCIGLLDLSPQEFLELEPWEINLKIESYNDRKRERHQDIYNLAALIGTAVNAPKKFPDFTKFYPDQRSKTAVHNEEKIIKTRLRRRGFVIHS